MKVLITTGGGGHFAAARAVIEALPKDTSVQVIGRKYTFEGKRTLSFEYQTAKAQGIPFASVMTGKLQRHNVKNTAFSLLKLPIGVAQATKILKAYQPDVVLSFGGYISIPVVLAAHLLKIPIVIHEQVLGAGIANKIASRFAKKICISWPSSASFFSAAKVVLTGNPVKKEIITLLQGQAKKQTDLPTLVVTGGSAGSHAINTILESCLPVLLEKYRVIHQTGDTAEFADFERLQQYKKVLPKKLQVHYILEKFISQGDLAAYFAEARLVISRSGINTVTELLLLQKPCILIPFPYGQTHEQLQNAKLLQKLGLAEIIEQHELTPEMLVETIAKIYLHPEEYTFTGNAQTYLLHTKAAEHIISIVTYVGKQACS